MNTEINNESEEPIIYQQNLKEHCEVAALILRTLPSTSNTRHHVKAAIRQASHQVSSVRGGNNHVKAAHMSTAAYAQMQLGQFDQLIAEHMVPVKVVVDKVLTLPIDRITWAEIRDMVVKFSRMALITEKEDDSLTMAGLAACMPANWDGMDLYARYNIVGIELKVNEYSSLRRTYR